MYQVFQYFLYRWLGDLLYEKPPSEQTPFRVVSGNDIIWGSSCLRNYRSSCFVHTGEFWLSTVLSRQLCPKCILLRHSELCDNSSQQYYGNATILQCFLKDGVS